LGVYDFQNRIARLRLPKSSGFYTDRLLLGL
jgi:hypothetical protein